MNPECRAANRKWKVSLTAYLVLTLWVSCSYAGVIDVERLADAIHKTENSNKYPYGIKSVKCSGEVECRKICVNSIRNNIKRWEKAGKPKEFIPFMGDRYSPPSSNPNWVRLVTFFYNK